MCHLERRIKIQHQEQAALTVSNVEQEIAKRALGADKAARGYRAGKADYPRLDGHESRSKRQQIQAQRIDAGTGGETAVRIEQVITLMARIELLGMPEE